MAMATLSATGANLLFGFDLMMSVPYHFAYFHLTLHYGSLAMLAFFYVRWVFSGREGVLA